MTEQQFDEIFDKTIGHLKFLKDAKAKDYASQQDRLHNFKMAAQLQGTSPLAALKGMMSKQEVCILDMIYNVDSYDPEFIDRNIDDVMMYLVLLKALILERNELIEKRKAAVNGATNQAPEAFKAQDPKMHISKKV